MQKQQKKKQEKNKSGLNNLVKYSSLGFEMLGIMAILIFLGIKMDKWLELNNIFTASLTILSVFVALYYVIQKLK